MQYISKSSVGRIASTIVTALLLLLVGCEQSPLESDLDNGNLHLDTLSSGEISGVTYQVPPTLGSLSSLYVGQESGFVSHFSLIKFYDYAANNTAFTWQDFVDSTVSIDSAYFLIRFAEDSVTSNPEIDLYTLLNSDSVFNESRSHYLNLSEDNLGGLEWTDSRQLERIPSDTGDYYLKFSIDTTTLFSFADTNFTPQFLLKTDDNLTEFIPLRSRDSDFTPKLEIYFRRSYIDNNDEMVVDTLYRRFVPNADLSVIQPPELTAIDTAGYSIGRGLGLRSVIWFDFKSILDTLHTQSLFRKAELSLDSQSPDSTASFSIIAYPLADSVDFRSFQKFDSDDYAVNTGYPLDVDDRGDRIIIDIKSFVQSMLNGEIENLGIKLFASTTNDPLQTLHLFDAGSDSSHAQLRIEYVSP